MDQIGPPPGEFVLAPTPRAGAVLPLVGGIGSPLGSSSYRALPTRWVKLCHKVAIQVTETCLPIRVWLPAARMEPGEA